MADDRYHFEPLGKDHDRASFSCGVDALDRYLHQRAGQDVRRRLAAVWVLHDIEAKAVAGYYTLSTTSIEPTELPATIIRKLARYPTLPAVLLGRLAVDTRYRGQGFGELLLIDALRRAYRYSDQIAAMAIIVDAKDDAHAFYERYGFQRLADNEHRLFIPMASLAQL